MSIVERNAICMRASCRQAERRWAIAARVVLDAADAWLWLENVPDAEDGRETEHVNTMDMQELSTCSHAFSNTVKTASASAAMADDNHHDQR